MAEGVHHVTERYRPPKMPNPPEAIEAVKRLTGDPQALRRALDDRPPLIENHAREAAAPRAAKDAAKFRLERWEEIHFDFDEEFLIDGFLPKQGVGLLYGASQTFKSFLGFHMGRCLAGGVPWAGRKTVRTSVVYIAAEGAAGLRKRKEGYVVSGRAPADDLDFALISAAPNLGVGEGDLGALIAAIECAGVKPGLIVVDTVAKAIGGADENGAGMAQFLMNAQALAQHFGCFVMAIHHTGWSEEAKDRPRGWSGLPAALDVMLLSQRQPGEMTATLTVQKLKDEPSGIRLAAHLDRVVLGVSRTHREISTLVVDEVVDAEATAGGPRPRIVPKQQRLLADVISEAIGEVGEPMRPFADGPEVRAVTDDAVREKYYAAIAEKRAPDEDPNKLAERQRKSFNRAVKAMIDAKRIVAREVNGRRMLWLPRPSA